MSGYAEPEDIRRFAEPFDGPFSHGVAEIARRTSTAIAYGYPEAVGQELYNSALCIDAHGQTIARQQKLMLPPGHERDIFSIGTNLAQFELHGLKMAFLICYDIEFPEAARAVSQAGVHVILAPTALGAQWDVVANRVVPSRAFENGAYVMYANHAGVENGLTYLGSSCIVGPDGNDLARANSDPALIKAEVVSNRVTQARQRLPYLQDLETLRPRLQ